MLAAISPVPRNLLLPAWQAFRDLRAQAPCRSNGSLITRSSTTTRQTASLPGTQIPPFPEPCRTDERRAVHDPDRATHRSLVIAAAADGRRLAYHPSRSPRLPSRPSRVVIVTEREAMTEYERRKYPPLRSTAWPLA